ncbi:hypothetical protein PLESTB_000584000 [Pleodorina starrii]|uniref:Uncharacterized protein n=1 Tax=Pleodorina starrii TaxID=330485 RepID=A0A9W6BH86_9CHLO|nr:hypothetical protein PLESTM_000300400 [Pleodorina starrii]GLC52112.1 hypothetical protein PLESTB_000584000 [Pleodorina starrii]GLC72259.1 hypothetical protein PLESTF_001224600 [Pleodorina starrii]
MVLSNWFSKLLGFLGLQHKSAKILFLGLDNAGKTTLLHVLRDDRVAQHQPTQYPTSEEIHLPSTCGSIVLRAFDLGGHRLVRSVWRDYFPRVDGVVFLLDSTDRERLPEAATELTALLREPCLADVPFLVLGNKIDLPGAASEGELRNWLGLPPPPAAAAGSSGAKLGSWGRLAAFFGGPAGARQGGGGGGGERPVELFMCSVLRRMGFGEGFRWLSQHIK